MSKDSTKMMICPACDQSLIDISELTDNTEDYTARAFCRYCREPAVLKNWRSNKTHISQLPSGLRSCFVNNYIDVMRQIFTPRYLSVRNEPIFFREAFRSIAGWVKSRQEFKIPAFNTWNNIEGSFVFRKTKFDYPSNPNAIAGLISTTYKPEKLVITDNPEQALAIRYATTEDPDIKNPYSVMILIPGKLPLLHTLQDPDEILLFVDDRSLRDKLVEILPPDAILSNRSIDVKPGVLMHILRGAECPALSLEEL